MILHVEKNTLYSVVNNTTHKLRASTEFFLLSLTAVPLRPQFAQTQVLWIKQYLIHVVFVYRASV